jgi:hypothetical protein
MVLVVLVINIIIIITMELTYIGTNYKYTHLYYKYRVIITLKSGKTLYEYLLSKNILDNKDFKEVTTCFIKYYKVKLKNIEYTLIQNPLL